MNIDPTAVAVPTLSSVALILILKGAEWWFSTRTEREKREQALRASLPDDERRFRATLMERIEELGGAVSGAEERERDCREELRHRDHKISNLQTAIWALERRLGIDETDFGTEFVEELPPEERRALRHAKEKIDEKVRTRKRPERR